MTNVEALKGAAFRPVLYEIENDYKNEDNLLKESIFTTNPLPLEEKINKEEGGGFFSAVGKFFTGIGNFFSGIFKGIGDFISGLFSKEDKTEVNNTLNKENDTKEIEKTETDRFKDIPDDVIEEWKPLIDELGGNIYYNSDGKLILELNIQNDEDVDFWGILGDVKDDYYNEDGQRILAIAVRDREHPLDKDLATRDGEIGYTRQGKTGDCWLLSGTNALSYTEKGREYIKNALEYSDGSTTVHFKGAKDYIITDKEVETARLADGYSTGDDDMLILELAAEKAFADIFDGNITVPEYVQKCLDQKEDDSLDGSSQNVLFYLLTGKESEIYSHEKDAAFKEIFGNNPENNPYLMSSALETFEENNNKDYALGITLSYDPATIEDINGDKIELDAPHAYAIKDIEDNTVTIVDPHDSSIDIELAKDTVLNTFDYFMGCNLSSN